MKVSIVFTTGDGRVMFVISRSYKTNENDGRVFKGKTPPTRRVEILFTIYKRRMAKKLAS